MLGFPDIEGFYDMLYGTAGVDLQTMTLMFFGGSSGIVFSGNPPYTVTNFLSIYPKFFGAATNITGDTTANSNVLSNISSMTGLAKGQLLVNPNFPADCLILDIGTNSITVSQNATVSAANVDTSVYTSPFIPLIAIQTYVCLARASVMIARYQDSWFMAMSYFIAHYCTLYMRSEAGPNLTASQVASSGLTKGIIVHRAAGDVSATSEIIEGYEEWGAWRETQYGELFITLARAINCGPIWVQ